MSSIVINSTTSTGSVLDLSSLQQSTDRYPRSYLTGSTVLLRVGTSEPGTRIPQGIDQAVLDGLYRVGAGGALTPFTPPVTTFTTYGIGLYTLALDTFGFLAGPYLWRVRVHAGAFVTLAEDVFVIKALGAIDGRLLA